MHALAPVEATWFVDHSEAVSIRAAKAESSSCNGFFLLVVATVLLLLLFKRSAFLESFHRIKAYCNRYADPCGLRVHRLEANDGESK